jgi:hypothetical protein
MADTIGYTYKNHYGNRTFVNTSLDAWGVQTLKGFYDFVVQGVNDIGTKDDVLWAAVVRNSSLNYKNEYSDYELLVPVTNNNTVGDTYGDTYYFYMEIP